MKKVQLISCLSFNDIRGDFKKFEFPFKIAESFYSTNKAGVFRGMHYQRNTAKFVYVSKGEVLDIWLNLKTGEWGQYHLGTSGVYIPAGYAHGFYSLTDSVIHYVQDKPYNKDEEGGIAWNSFGFKLPDPILSERDKKHPIYENFCSNSHL